jgi:hypothetical protein
MEGRDLAPRFLEKRFVRGKREENEDTSLALVGGFCHDPQLGFDFRQGGIFSLMAHLLRRTITSLVAFTSETPVTTYTPRNP